MQPTSVTVNLSTIIQKANQYFNLNTKATLWFNALFSLFQQYEHQQIRDDTTLHQKIQLIKILSHAVSAVGNFYEQQRPNGIFKLLNIGSYVLDLMDNVKDYSVIISKINYLNNVCIYGIKTKQYSFSIDIFNEIHDIYNSKIIDNVNQFFLSFFNNFLTFLRRSSKKMASRLIEVQNQFKDLFVKFLAKVILYDRASNIIESYINTCILLVAIYKQNQTILNKYQKDVNALAIHSYQLHLNTKKRLPESMIDFIMKQKVNKQIYYKIDLNLDEIKFYSSNKIKYNNQLQNSNNQQQKPQKKLNKIQNMIGQSIELLNQQKIISARYSSLRYQAQANKSIGHQSYLTVGTNQKTSSNFQNKNSITLEPITKPNQFGSIISPIKSNRPALKRAPTKLSKPVFNKITKLKTTIFKIRSIFIQVNQDGILLSDYTKQNKRYVQWNTLSMILDRIQLQFPIEEFLKISLENYYDFTRILSCYLTKNDNRDICLLENPLPLLEINELLKLYKQEGKFFKLALMNHYDSSRFVGIIDFYISQFYEFFKNLNQNEYIISLNQKISKKNTGLNEKQQTTYLIDYLKRKRYTTVEQLRNQLNIDHLQYAIGEREAIYKCVFLCKNNVQLYVKILDNIKKQQSLLDFVIQIKIQNVSQIGNQNFYLQSQKHKQDKKINKLIEIKLEKITKYFPIYSQSIRKYLNCYSRMIIDILNRFEEHLSQINLASLSFQIMVYASKTQTIQYGKFFSIISAEVIGSKERIWALIIRFYDLAYVTQKITVLMNPYAEFLQSFLTISQDQKHDLLNNLLLNGSVKDTYNWLKLLGKLQKRLNIFQYLYGTGLI